MNATWLLETFAVGALGAATAVYAGRALADLLPVAPFTGIASAALLFMVALWLVNRR